MPGIGQALYTRLIPWGPDQTGKDFEGSEDRFESLGDFLWVAPLGSEESGHARCAPENCAAGAGVGRAARPAVLGISQPGAHRAVLVGFCSL